MPGRRQDRGLVKRRRRLSGTRVVAVAAMCILCGAEVAHGGSGGSGRQFYPHGLAAVPVFEQAGSLISSVVQNTGTGLMGMLKKTMSDSQQQLEKGLMGDSVGENAVSEGEAGASTTVRLAASHGAATGLAFASMTPELKGGERGGAGVGAANGWPGGGAEGPTTGPTTGPAGAAAVSEPTTGPTTSMSSVPHGPSTSPSTRPAATASSSLHSDDTASHKSMLPTDVCDPRLSPASHCQP